VVGGGIPGGPPLANLSPLICGGARRGRGCSRCIASTAVRARHARRTAAAWRVVAARVPGVVMAHRLDKVPCPQDLLHCRRLCSKIEGWPPLVDADDCSSTSDHVQGRVSCGLIRLGLGAGRSREDASEESAWHSHVHGAPTLQPASPTGTQSGRRPWWVDDDGFPATIHRYP
jgi:hypothetical protein